MSIGNKRPQARGNSQIRRASLRIMPLGDSITVGYTDSFTWEVPFSFGYRAPLYRSLTEAGFSFEFVGASEEPFDNRFGVPSCEDTSPPVVDFRKCGADHHRGYGGYGIDQIASNIKRWIKEDIPDLILLMIGINGICSESPAKLKRLVNMIYTIDPKVSIIIAEITPLIEYDENLFRYNHYIREKLVPTYQERGFTIHGVDQYTQYLTDPSDPQSINKECFSNKINHPTNRYYDMIAERWFEVIVAIYPIL